MIKDIDHDKLERQHEFGLHLRRYTINAHKLIDDSTLREFNLPEILDMLDEIYWSCWRETLKAFSGATRAEYLNIVSVFSMTRLNIFRKAITKYFYEVS